MEERPNATPEQFNAAATKADRILGRFTAEVGEEITTTKTYPLPDSGLTITATVFYTDETMDSSESMWQGLAVTKEPVENAILAPGASITEVNFDDATYKVRTKQRVLVEGKAWVVGLECQCMTIAERRKRITGKQQN